MGRLRHIFVLFLVLSGSIYGQSDSLYIRTFPEKLTFRLAYQTTENDFLLTSRETGESFLITPNKTDYLGISALFRSIELDLGFTPNFIQDSDELEDSKLLTFNFRIFLGQWMQTIDFYLQEGFFIRQNGMDLPLPDFETFKIGGNTAYIFNENFSFRAIGSQNEWQLKSAGSFIPRMTFYYTSYDAGLPETNDKIHSFDWLAGPGYYYNWVLGRKFILSLGGAVGIGMNSTEGPEESLISIAYEGGVRAVAGYNSERWFFGVNSDYLFLEHNTDRATRVNDRLTFFECYLGYRFDAPKSFLRAADKVNSKLGL